MHNRDQTDLDITSETESKATTAKHSPTLISAVNVTGADVHVQTMINGDVAMLIMMAKGKRILKIYDNANLSACKIEHKLPHSILALTLCPNGDWTAHERTWVTGDYEGEWNPEDSRVVIDPYTLETKKN